MGRFAVAQTNKTNRQNCVLKGWEGAYMRERARHDLSQAAAREAGKKRDNVLIIQIKFTIVGYLHRLIIIQITFIEMETE